MTLSKYYQTEIFEVMTDLTVIVFRLVCFSKMAADAIENSWSIFYSNVEDNILLLTHTMKGDIQP